jgi:ClpP class serine protease
MHSILLQVLRANWYIDFDYAKGIGFVIQQGLNGKLAFERTATKIPEIRSSYLSNNGNTSSSGRDIAIIRINQVLMKHDQECGPAGMDTIGGWIKDLNANPSVGAIVLQLSTPGGTVEGTHILGEVIKSSEKPIIAYVDEMACSGGYWIASQCKEIWASSPRARVGSIGVMISYMDMQPYWEAQNVKFIEEYSNLSPDKNKLIRQLDKGNAAPYKEKVLDPLALDFQNVVKSTRNLSDKTILDGRDIFADEGIAVGLVDRIGTIEEVIARATELAEDYQEKSAKASISAKNIPITKNQNGQSSTDERQPINEVLTKPKITMKQFKNIALVVGVESFEVQDGFISLSEEMMEALEARLELAETDKETIQTLKGGYETMQASIPEKDARIAELEPQAAEAETLRVQAQEQTQTIAQRDTRIQELESEVTSLRRAAGADPSIITSKADPGQQSNEDPLLAKINATEDTNERMALMREHGYV